MNGLVQQGIAPMQEWQNIKDQALTLVQSGMLPKAINTPEKAIVIMVKGRELGIPPMHAFNHIHVIDGKPTMSAELMLTMIVKNVPDARIKYLQNDGDACRLEASRNAMGKMEFGFSRQDATAAQLMHKDNWKKYTRAMLRSRAISEMGRSMFPDALCGMSYTPEEIGGEVEVTDSGEIVVIEEVIQPERPKPTIVPAKPIVPAKAETPVDKPRDPKWNNVFVDSEKSWEWLEKLFDRCYLAEDCRRPIREVAIGKTAHELDQLAYLASLGHDDEN